MLTRTLRTTLPLALLIPLALTALLAPLVLTPPARAAEGCFVKGPNRVIRSDDFTKRVTTAFCTAYQSGDVVYDGRRVGRLEAGRSWFVCQKRFPGVPNPKVAGARSDYWLFTKADHSITANGGWGWFPATKISGGVNHNLIPGLRLCPANF